jgi:hypothetical protein
MAMAEELVQAHVTQMKLPEQPTCPGCNARGIPRVLMIALAATPCSCRHVDGCSRLRHDDRQAFPAYRNILAADIQQTPAERLVGDRQFATRRYDAILAEGLDPSMRPKCRSQRPSLQRFGVRAVGTVPFRLRRSVAGEFSDDGTAIALHQLCDIGVIQPFLVLLTDERALKDC